MAPLLAALALLLCTAQAAVPQRLQPRAVTTCNRDDCYRQVFGTTISGRSAQGTAACTSYLQKTVTACTSTSTSTSTVTSAGATSTVSVTTTTTAPAVLATTTVTVTTSTTTTPTTVTTTTSTSTITATATTTTTVTAHAKRELLEGRAASVCPVTASASSTATPAYASSCTGTRFSSVCSCNSNVPTAITTTPIASTTTTSTVLTTTTVTASATTTVTPTNTATSTSTVALTITAPVTTSTVTATTTTTTTTTTTVTTTVSAPTGNAYCENGQPVNGLSPACTAVGCSTTNLRIEGSSGTIYEGVILAGPRSITTPSGGTHLCDGTNNNANPAPFDNGISTIDAASLLCGFTYDGTFDSEFQDFFIQRIGDTAQNGDEFWGILLNYAFTPAGGCETEVRPTDELLWAFNAFNVNFFLRVEPTQTPVVLAPGQTTTFTVQGADGNGDPFVGIAGASFNGQTSDANGNVPFTAPTVPGTYRYKATRADSIRSNAVTIVVQG